MPRIKIENLPKKIAVSNEEMKNVRGGWWWGGWNPWRNNYWSNNSWSRSNLVADNSIGLTNAAPLTANGGMAFRSW